MDKCRLQYTHRHRYGIIHIFISAKLQFRTQVHTVHPATPSPPLPLSTFDFQPGYRRAIILHNILLHAMRLFFGTDIIPGKCNKNPQLSADVL